MAVKKSLSIHFPLTREDAKVVHLIFLMMFFQSTSLSRGKTNVQRSLETDQSLSIHFPLTREDLR